MSATVRKGESARVPRLSGRTQQVLVVGRRGVPVNWSNKASPAQWRARRQSRRR